MQTSFMQTSFMQQVIGGIVLDNKRVLVVRKRNTFILPGGKLDAGETDQGCLQREFEEELSRTRIRVGRYYRDFLGISPDHEKPINVRCYFASIEGDLGPPSGEIEETRWINGMDRLNYSDVTLKIIESLRNHSYIR